MVLPPGVDLTDPDSPAATPDRSVDESETLYDRPIDGVAASGNHFS
jgi:hypothetical protein